MSVTGRFVVRPVTCISAPCDVVPAFLETPCQLTLCTAPCTEWRIAATSRTASVPGRWAVSLLHHFVDVSAAVFYRFHVEACPDDSAVFDPRHDDALHRKGRTIAMGPPPTP